MIAVTTPWRVLRPNPKPKSQGRLIVTDAPVACHFLNAYQISGVFRTCLHCTLKAFGYNYKLRDILSKGPKYREPRTFTWKQNFKLILDSVEEYARRWAKKEDVEVDTLFECVKSVMSLVNRRVSVLSRTMSRRHESVFDDQDGC